MMPYVLAIIPVIVVLLILSFHNRQQHNSKPKEKRTSILFHPILTHCQNRIMPYFSNLLPR